MTDVFNGRHIFKQENKMNSTEVTPLEAKRYAKLREEQGKPPKIEPGQKTEEDKSRLMLGRLVENILGQIKLLELVLGQSMFLKLDVPMQDGRQFKMELTERKVIPDEQA